LPNFEQRDFNIYLYESYNVTEDNKFVYEFLVRFRCLHELLEEFEESSIIKNMILRSGKIPFIDFKDHRISKTRIYEEHTVVFLP